MQYFNNEEQLTAHRMVHHAQTNATNQVTVGTGAGLGAGGNGNGSEKAYECTVCMKTFSKHSSWWKHKKCHTGERAYKCYICEKSFTQQANLHRVNNQSFDRLNKHKNIRKINLSSFRFLFFWFIDCSICSYTQAKNLIAVKFVINASHRLQILWNIRSYIRMKNHFNVNYAQSNSHREQIWKNMKWCTRVSAVNLMKTKER